MRRTDAGRATQASSVKKGKPRAITPKTARVERLRARVVSRERLENQRVSGGKYDPKQGKQQGGLA